MAQSQITTMVAAAVLTALAAPQAVLSPAAIAQTQGRSSTTLSERQELMRRITQQQQSVLQQRFTCINRATNVGELEACERGYPVLGPGWRHGGGMGGWTCPMW